MLTWDMDVGTLTSVTSYDHATNSARGEQPPRTPALGFLNSQWRDTTTWSQEIRLTSPDDQPFRWILGGYYLDTDAFLSTSVQRNTRGIDAMDTFIKKNPLSRWCNPPAAPSVLQPVGYHRVPVSLMVCYRQTPLVCHRNSMISNRLKY